jgi:molybdate transport system regulatory protein
MPKPKPLAVKMRIRVYAGEWMLGPGKMELLAHILATGSLKSAARKMRMSYMRAWTLVKDLNRNSNRPMVEMSRGGVGGGTAKVTQFGQKVLALYQSMDRESTNAAGPYSRKLVNLLK